MGLPNIGPIELLVTLLIWAAILAVIIIAIVRAVRWWRAQRPVGPTAVTSDTPFVGPPCPACDTATIVGVESCSFCGVRLPWSARS